MAGRLRQRHLAYSGARFGLRRRPSSDLAAKGLKTIAQAAS